MRRFCPSCLVAWTGEPSCWVCGEPGVKGDMNVSSMAPDTMQIAARQWCTHFSQSQVVHDS